MTESPLSRWHRVVRERDITALGDLLADDVVFHSPVVHTPQHGRPVVERYLAAAIATLANPTFRYVREIVDGETAMLEFEVEMDGIVVNGVDLITWNGAGQIVAFKVFVRPLKAINLVHQAMAARLPAMP